MSRPVRGPRAAAAALAVGFLLTACTGGSGGSGTQQYVSGSGVVTTVSAADRRAAPAVTGSTLDGASFDLASLRGKVVVLNFWASWCAPCRAEGPSLQVVAADLAPQGVVFVGVDSRDEDLDRAKAFLQNIGSSYDNVDDSDGHVALSFHGTLPPDAVPSTIVVDRDGRIAARVVGPTTEPRLRALLAPLVAEAAS